MRNHKTEKENPKRNWKTWAAVVALSAACILGANAIVDQKAKKPEEVQYKEFVQMVNSGEVDEIQWAKETDTFIFIADGRDYKTENPKYDNFKKDMLQKGVPVKEHEDFFEKHNSVIVLGINICMYMLLFSVFLAKMRGDDSPMFKKKKEKEKSTVTFQDVAGLEEVKEDLMTVVDFLKNPEKYKESGAEIPKGVLLYGPPGTGKTLLAKAVAGEAGVEFRAVSGSDFEEKYVGVGASRMRKLFQEAKNNAPCIIFIDEIDSMGGRRHSRQRDTDRQTLNTLLSEMDGFDGSNGVVVIAATNRLEDLDPALTRPGRFDSHFAVNLPETAKERQMIIRLYSKNKKFADDVDLETFSKETLGCSPATIKTVLNEAAIIAARRADGIIDRAILDEAWMKQLMEGHMKKNREKENIDLVAWHEAGHALAGLLLGQDLTKASIIPSTSGAGGATFITPKKMGLFSKKELEDQVVMLYAGRNAEAIFSKEDDGITTGASNDIEKATGLIQKMVTEYGMTDAFGLLNLEMLDEKDTEQVMKEMVKISDDLRTRSITLLQEHKEQLQAIAEALAEKETLTGKEIREIAGI